MHQKSKKHNFKALVTIVWFLAFLLANFNYTNALCADNLFTNSDFQDDDISSPNSTQNNKIETNNQQPIQTASTEPIKGEIETNSTNLDTIEDPSSDAISYQDPLNNDKFTVFNIRIETPLNSKTAKIGDNVSARTDSEFYLNHEFIPINTKITGKVTYVLAARSIMKSELTKNKFFHSGGFIGLEFDTIHLPYKNITISAKPCPKTKVVKKQIARPMASKENKNNISTNKPGAKKLKFRKRVALVVGDSNLITPSLIIATKNNLIPMAIHASAMAGGFYSMAILPVAYGTAGALFPSFTLRHEIAPDMKHPRLKGFGVGFVEGLPGGFLLANVLIKGDETNLVEGDKFSLLIGENKDYLAYRKANKKGATIAIKSGKAELAKDKSK